MTGINALLISVALAVAGSWLENATKFPWLWTLILGTAAWVGWDSAQVRVREYKSTVAIHPVVLALGVVALWIVFFPWYLVVRSRILAGTQPRKDSGIEGPAATHIPHVAATVGDDLMQLERLGDLRVRGALTEEEFVAAKARVLDARRPS